jgi:DNA-binding CsgD family transcriptional regulator
VLGVVREVFYPHLGQGEVPLPGGLALVVVSAEEPGGKPIAECEKVTVVLRVHRGGADDEGLVKLGPDGWRKSRLAPLCQEALSQGGVLTREDLAWRVFFVSPRTISRDLAALRESDPKLVIPLRSIRHDIGPVLTHRVRIVELALDGKTTTEICRAMRHSPEAVSNYVSTFVRCAQLAGRGLEASQIAFLVRRGRKLVEQYLELAKTAAADKNRAYHFERLLELAQLGEVEKKAQPRRQTRRNW